MKLFIRNFTILLLLAASLLESVVASASDLKKDYFVKLSADNHLEYSQSAAGDLSFSAISGLAYISDSYGLNDNILHRLALGYGAFQIALLNHEISGHGFRGVELGGEIEKINIGVFGGSARTSNMGKTHFQERAVISLGGNETNYLLSQKIANSLLEHNQPIDPIMGFGYIFSAGNQLFYTYFNSMGAGHDLKSYSDDMEKLYGSRSMTLGKIRSRGLLDMLDPVMLTSIYSAATGENVEIPRLQIADGFAISPFARNILAPYGALETKVGAYIFTDYTPIKIGLSYGKQSKTRDVKELTYHEEKTLKTLVLEGKVKSDNSWGHFTGLNAGGSLKNYTTYSADISIFKLFEVGNLKIGLDAAFWSQPELFVQDPYRAKPKNGYMAILNGSYKFKENMSFIARAGYKTKGFVPGHFLDKTPILSIALQYKL